MRFGPKIGPRSPLEFEVVNALTGEYDVFDWSNPLVCHGKGSGGGTNTVTQNSSPPPQVLAAYQTAINSAQQAASAPLQQYSGATVAGFTPDQLSAFGTIDNAQNSAQPFIQGAQNLINQGTQPLWSGVQQFSPGAISQYQSPYTQQVLQSQEAVEQNQDAQQQQALKGNAISSGAWGGDRAGVASAALSGQQDIANNATNASILNQGYSQGLSEFNTQQQAQLGANEANSYLNQQGAFGLANLGNESLGTQLQGASSQLQSGALQQQLGQEQLNVPYENFLQAQAYPFQSAAYFANLAEGTGGLEGGTATTTSPAASSTSQLAGLGLGGLGLLGSAFGGSSTTSGAASSAGGLSSLFKNRGGRIPYRTGGHVRPRRYDSGGGVQNPGQPFNLSTVAPNLDVSIIPQTQPGRGKGPPNPPPAYKEGQGAGGLGGTGLSAQNFSSIGKSLGSLFNSGSSGDSGLSLMSSDFGGSDVAGEMGSSEGLSLADASDLSSFFRRGGVARPHPYAIGGQVLPDVLSGIGDIVGAFFGDPMAGDQGVGLLSAVDGGRTGGEGIEGRAMGSLFGQGDTNGGSGFDDGGTVGGQSPTTAAYSGSQQPTQGSALNNMSPQQLQNYLMRLPVGSPQAAQIQQTLNQKRMMPNTGAQAVGGLGTGTPQGQPQFARGGFADGGDTDYSNGIPLDGPPPPDVVDGQLSRAQELGDLPSPVASPVPASALKPPPGSFGAGPPDATVADASPDSKPMKTADASDSMASPEDKYYADQTPPNSRAPARADPWMALANAGFAMAAGQSPQAMTNIGAGALAGIKNYEDQRTKADSVNENADKLMEEAQQHKDTIKIEQQKADQEKAYQTGVLQNQQNALKQKSIIKDGFGNPVGVFDPETNSVKPLTGMPGSSSFNVNGSLNGATQGAPAQVAGQAATAAPASALPDEMQQRLQQIAPNAKDQALITGLIQGRIAPNRQSLGSNPQAYIAAAADVDPTFDAANPTQRMKTAADYSPGGASGKLITSLNTASRHAAATALAAIDLNNTSGFPGATTANSLINSAEQSAGDSRMTNYDSYLGNYGHEAIKVISGKTNPGEAETETFVAPLKNNGSPEQILGALSAKNGMMLSRAEEMQKSYNNSMGTGGRQQAVVSPDAQQAFGDMDTLYAASKQGTLNSPEAQAAKQRLEVYARPAQQAAQTMAASKIPPPSSRVPGQTYPTPKGALMWGTDGQWHKPVQQQGGP